MSKGMYYRRFASGTPAGRTNVMNLLKQFEKSDNPEIVTGDSKNGASNSENPIDKTAKPDPAKKRTAPMPPCNANPNVNTAKNPAKNPKRRPAPLPPKTEKQVIIITKSERSTTPDPGSFGSLSDHPANIGSTQAQHHRQNVETDKKDQPFNVPPSHRPKSPFEETSTDFSCPENPPSSNVGNIPRKVTTKTIGNGNNPGQLQTTRQLAPLLPELQGLSITERKTRFEQSRQLLEKTLQASQKPPKEKRVPSEKISGIKKRLEDKLIFKVAETQSEPLVDVPSKTATGSNSASSQSEDVSDREDVYEDSDLESACSGDQANTYEFDSEVGMKDQQNQDASEMTVTSNTDKNNTTQQGDCIESDKTVNTPFKRDCDEKENQDDKDKTVETNSVEDTKDEIQMKRTPSEQTTDVVSSVDDTITSGYISGNNSKLRLSATVISYIVSLDISRPIDI